MSLGLKGLRSGDDIGQLDEDGGIGDLQYTLYNYLIF
jgi:hypothetical protein